MGLEEEMRGTWMESRDDGRGTRSTAAGLFGSAKSWVEAVVGDIAAATNRTTNDARQSKQGTETIRTEAAKVSVRSRGGESLCSKQRRSIGEGTEVRAELGWNRVEVRSKQRWRRDEGDGGGQNGGANREGERFGALAGGEEVEKRQGRTAGVVTWAEKEEPLPAVSAIVPHPVHKSEGQSVRRLVETPNRKRREFAAGRKRTWTRRDLPVGSGAQLST